MKRTLLAVLFATGLAAQGNPWPAHIVERFESIPVQDDGRVKPLRTVASFALLRMHGSRLLSSAGVRLDPVEWILDVLLRPEIATRQSVFRVENDEVLDAIGAPHEGKRKRDRYSYEELSPHRDRLFTLARKYAQIDPQEQSPVERQVLVLAKSLSQFESLSSLLEFARTPLEVPADSPTLQRVLGSGPVSFSQVLRQLDRVLGSFHDVAAGGEMSDEARAEMRRVAAFLEQVERLSHAGDALMWIPPEETDREAWMTFHDVLAEPASPARDRRIEIVTQFEVLAAAVGDPAEFDRRSAALHERLVSLAEARGEYGKIGTELLLYSIDPFYRALVLFVLAFGVCMLGWLWPRNRWLWRAAWGLTLIPAALVILGIVLRCIVQSRPPMLTLYDTTLFIVACIAVVGFIIEIVNRRRIGLTLAAFLGGLGMFIARRHEEIESLDRSDTMGSVQAVLDTNFWLSTHVTTVTLGYAAGLLAAAIAHVYVLGKLFRWRRDDAPFYRAIARMVYGVICFGLLFSVVGTILGGVWANDSWGRFWGWDPKENGALMICLWEIAMLHARMGGYLKDFGFCLASIFGGIVVAFSWWGVNQLGVGLHSYGFTSGISLALNIFYASQLVVLGLGAVVMWQGQRDAAAAAQDAGA